MDAPSAAEALAFLDGGALPSAAEPRAYLRSCLKVPEFRAKVWPHFACFVDASNVARRRPVPVHEVNTPKARLADLDAAVEALRALRYVPIVVSDANLFQLIDQPYEWKKKYSEYPHSVAAGRQADNIVLRALRKLPEAACVSNDRFSKPDEVRDFADVLALQDCFYRHAWDSDAPAGASSRQQVAAGDVPRFVGTAASEASEDGRRGRSHVSMPHAHDRLLRRLGVAPRAV